MKIFPLPLKSIVPSMPVVRMSDSLEFYERLGFEVMNRDGSNMAVVQNEGLQVVLWTCLLKDVPVNYHVYINVDDVDDLRDKLEERGLKNMFGPQDHHRDMRMLVVVDPSGHSIRFLSRRAAS